MQTGLEKPRFITRMFPIHDPVSHSHAIWRNPAHDVDFLALDLYLGLATTLERGKFDLVFFADRV